jgi:hypothetical protein
MSPFPMFVVKAFYRKGRPYYDHKQTVLSFSEEKDARDAARALSETQPDSVHIQVRDNSRAKWRHL